jgi:very-short-patch-repair endonuclease
VLRGTLDARAAGFDRSKAERMLMRLILRAGLPTPERNARIGRWEADFLWRDQRLIVETDGYAGHAGPEAFHRDRRRTESSSSPAMT